MLREFTLLNPGTSRNLRKILLTMFTNGGGVPITRRKGNLMVCICTIHPKKMMNEMKKSIKTYQQKKRVGTNTP